MGFLSRLPNPNEPEKDTWHYGPQEPHDDISAMLNGLAKRCKECKRVTMNKHLSIMGHCPECYNPTAKYAEKEEA